MSLFEEASLVITPNAFKAGKLYAVKGADLDVVRATGANRINASGANETMGANVPRIDYSGGGCPNILVEPQRTNSILNSATVANQTIITGAVAYTLSFYGSGTITLSGTHTATVVGTGTTRKTYTFTAIVGALVLTVSGTCTNGQLEAGSYATSYIPTTSASVTRNADVISKTGISSLIGQTEGTVFIELDIKNTIANRMLIVLSSANPETSTSEAYFYINPSGNLVFEFYTAGVAQCSISAGAVQVGFQKLAFVYKNNDFAFYRNGTLVGNDTGGTVVSGLDRLFLGCFTNSGLQLNDRIKSAAIWKTRLSNEKLSELTTI